MRKELATPAGTPLNRILDRAVDRGEITVSAQTRRFVQHVMMSISIARHLVEGEAPDRPYLEEFVDVILMPVLRPGAPVGD